MIKKVLVVCAMFFATTYPAHGDDAKWVSVDFRDGSQHSGWAVASHMMQSCTDKKIRYYAAPEDHAITLSASPCDNPAHVTTPNVPLSHILFIIPTPVVPDGKQIDPNLLKPEAVSRSGALRTFLSSRGSSRFQIVDPSTRKLLSTDEFSSYLKARKKDGSTLQQIYVMQTLQAPKPSTSPSL